MTRPKSDLEALRLDLHAAYDGDPWHGPSITSVLRGIHADAAARRSIPAAHTIWELVLHMAVWTREVASRVRGADAKNPPEDWPAPKFGGGERGVAGSEGRSRSSSEGARAGSRCAQARRPPPLDRRPARSITRNRRARWNRDPRAAPAPRVSSGPDLTPQARRDSRTQAKKSILNCRSGWP